MQSKPDKNKKGNEKVVELPGAKNRQRHPIIYVLSFFLLVVIVVTFVGGPAISGAAGSRSQFVFGTYGKEDIEFIQGGYFARQREAIAAQMSNQSDNGLSTQYQLYQLWRTAYENTVLHTALLQMGADSGLSVSDRRIDREIIEYGPYTVNGAFSEELFAEASTSEKQSTRELFFDSIIHDQITSDLLQDLKFSEAEKQFFKDMASPESRYQYISMKYDDFPQSEVLAFAVSNPAVFRKIHLYKITFGTDVEIDTAEDVLGRIKSGDLSFSDAATQYSQDLYAEKGGDFGVRFAYDLQDTFKTDDDFELVMSLDKDEYSPVLDTNYGYMIYRGEAAAFAPDFSAEEDLTAAEDYMFRYERGVVEDYLVARADQIRTDARVNDFAAAAVTAGKTIFTTEFFPVNYGGAFYLKSIVTSEENSMLPNAAGNRGFFEKIAGMAIDDISEPLVIDENVYLFQLIERRDAPEEDLALLENYFEYIMLQNEESEFRTAVMNSPEFEDNFAAAFSRYVLAE